MSTKGNSDNTPIPVFATAYTASQFETWIETIIEKTFSKYLTNMSTTPDPEELLTREEAAREFKVSIATIDNYKRRGLLIPKRIGGTVRYLRSSVHAAFSGDILNPYKAPKNGKK